MRRDGFVHGLLALLLLFGTARCGGGASSDESPAVDDSLDASGTGGGTTGAGGQGTSGAETTGGGAGKAGTGGNSAGSSGGGSLNRVVDGSTGQGGSSTPGVWVDISPPSANKKCNGVVVNRLTGDVLADVNDGGIWKSTDRGGTWTRVDGGAVGGLVVTGPAFDVDQNDPTRVAAWSLDGTPGWTSDGSTWRKMAPMGRNWDFGATDWATPSPKTMFGSLHESSGAVYVSTDGATSWKKLSVIVLASGAGFPPPAFAMVGVMDATTLIYGNGDGIYRSVDTGATFTKVSPLNSQTRIPVLFKGVFYLGGADGLIVSKDKGATWAVQGTARTMWVGPFFGADENTMVVADSKGVYKTTDAGMTWSKIANVPTDTKYDPRIWGGFAWDPNSNVIYAAATATPLLKMQL